MLPRTVRPVFIAACLLAILDLTVSSLPSITELSPSSVFLERLTATTFVSLPNSHVADRTTCGLTCRQRRKRSQAERRLGVAPSMQDGKHKETDEHFREILSGSDDDVIQLMDQWRKGNSVLSIGEHLPGKEVQFLLEGDSEEEKPQTGRDIPSVIYESGPLAMNYDTHRQAWIPVVDPPWVKSPWVVYHPLWLSTNTIMGWQGRQYEMTKWKTEWSDVTRNHRKPENDLYFTKQIPRHYSEIKGAGVQTIEARTTEALLDSSPRHLRQWRPGQSLHSAWVIERQRRASQNNKSPRDS